MAGDDRISVRKRLRLVLIAAVIGLALTLLVASVEWVKTVGDLVQALKRDLPGKVGDYFPGSPLSWKNVAPAWLAIGGLAYKWLAPAVDAALLSTHDLDVLCPITRHTGLLIFRLPEKGPVHDAWALLLEWARAGAGDGRTWRSNRPQVEKFTWTALLGPNGVGKTQLAKELARALAQREKWGDFVGARGAAAGLRRLRAGLGARVRRVLPWARTDNDPWDAGLVACRPDGTEDVDRLAALGRWRPRARTLLVLDDPGASIAARAIDLLKTNAGRFRFPVRLLVVDQFIGLDWPVTPNAEGHGWHHHNQPSRAFTPVTLAAPFTVDQFRWASGAFWIDSGGTRPVAPKSGADLQSLFETRDLQTLVDAVEGNPLLLALAILWLDADRHRSIDDLLRTELLEAERQLGLDGEHATLRDLVAHRLLSERIEDLYQSYRRLDDERGTELRKAVACATIAGGIETQAFGLAKLEQNVLRNLFPLAERGRPIRSIPPLRPWVLGECFIRKVHSDVYSSVDSTFEEEIIRPAFEARPATVLKAMSRGGALAKRIGQAVGRTPIPTEAQRMLVEFGPFASSAAIYDVAMSARALALAASLPAELLPHAMVQLDALEAQNEDGRADPFVTGVLRCSIWARRIAAPSCSDLEAEAARGYVKRWLTIKFLAGSTDLGLPFSDAVGALATALLGFIRRRYGAGDRFVHLATLDEEVCRFLSAPAQLLSDDKECATIADVAWRELWRLHPAVSQDDPTAVVQSVAAFDRQVESWDLGAAERALLRIRLRHLAIVYEGVSVTRASELGEEVEAIGSHFPEDPAIAIERMGAWQVVAGKHRGDLPRLVDVLRKMDTVGAPFEKRTDHPVLLTYWAAGWCVLGETEEHAEQAATRVEEICAPLAATPSAFPDATVQRARARRLVADARARQPKLFASTREAVAQVEALTVPFENSPLWHPWIAEERAAAWHALARGRTMVERERPSGTEEDAKRIDAIAAPFSRRPLRYSHILRYQAATWRLVAHARAQSDVERPRTEEAVRRIDAIAAPFRDSPLAYPALLGEEIDGWSAVVVARCQLATERARTEEAVLRVDQLAEPFASVPSEQPLIALLRARSYRFLGVARLHAGELARVEEAARKVDEIVASLAPPIDEKLAFEHATCWMHVVVALTDDATADADQVLQKVRRVDEIVSPFAAEPVRHMSLLAVQARTWLQVASAFAKRPGGLIVAMRAAQAVDRIASTLASEPGAEILEIQREAQAALAGHDERDVLGAPAVIP